MRTKICLPAFFMALIICAQTSMVQADTHSLQDITVTAQKNEENPQKVPISLDYFSDIQLEDARINNVFDLTTFSPNTHMMERSCEHIVVIRGISPFRGCTYSPAAFYVDEVSYPLHYMQNIDLFDLQRAEILKGPQGTLYGRNAESGVINLITKQPGNKLNGKISAEYGNYDSFRSVAGVGGPIVDDKLFLGLSGLFYSSDGYMENLANGDDKVADKQHAAGRAILRWTPSEHWDISLIADLINADDHGAEARLLSGPRATDPHKVRRDTDAYLRQDWNSQTLRASYINDTVKVVSISSTLYQTLDKVNDSDIWDDPKNKTINPNEMEERQYSQKLRVSSTYDSPLQWLLGVYGFTEDSKFDYRYEILSAGRTYMHPVTDVDTSGYAVFGQATYTMFDKLHLTAGVRFDHQSMEGSLRDEVQKVAYKKDLDFDEVLPKVSLSYDLSREVMAYASAAKGYLVGGYNWGLTGTPETFCFDPEYTWNYEVGLKSTWLDNKLVVNLSVFYISIDDKQVSELHPTIAATTITNAAEATSQGFELQLQAKPLPGLDIFGGFGYTEAKFDKFNATVWNDAGDALTTKNYEGNYLQYAPKYTYNIGAQYRGKCGIFARADLLGTGAFYGDAANKAEQSSYMTVNLQLGYEAKSLDFRLWMKNAFDEEYLTFLSPFQQTTVGIDGPPQTFGATLTYRF